MFVVYILIAVLMFGFLIAIHEFGHFFTAKLLGVRVNEFAIGMGPRIFHRQKGETEYSLRLFPIGGFCAMEGEDGEASDDPRSFINKPAWKRLIVLAAGAFMNFVAGMLIILVLFSLSGLPAMAVVTGYLPGAEDIARDGLLPGDQIYRVDGYRIYFQSDAMLFLERAGDHVELEIVRSGERFTLELDLPRRIPVEGENGETVMKRGLTVGAIEAATPWSVIKNTWYQSIDYVRLVWMGLGDLLTGNAGLKDMGGPIYIVQMMGEAGEAGAQAAQEVEGASPVAWAAQNIFTIVSFIAINLAVMNLLPIPALDGGQIFFLLVDKVYGLFTKKRINPKYLGYINAAGLICLLGLMVVVAFSDVFKLVGG